MINGQCGMFYDLICINSSLTNVFLKLDDDKASKIAFICIKAKSCTTLVEVAEPVQRNSIHLITKSLRIFGNHLVYLERMKA